MGFKDRLGLPNMAEMQQMMDSRFAQLIAKLDEILAELRTQRGG